MNQQKPTVDTTSTDDTTTPPKRKIRDRIRNSDATTKAADSAKTARSTAKKAAIGVGIATAAAAATIYGLKRRGKSIESVTLTPPTVDVTTTDV